MGADELPDIPMHVAGYGPRALGVAGRVGDGVIIQLADPQIIQSIWAPPARPPRRPDATPTRSVERLAPSHVTDDLAEARDQVRWFPAMVSNHVMDLIERYGEDSDEIPSRYRLRQGPQVLRLQGPPAVGAAHGEFVTDEICRDRFCVLTTPGRSPRSCAGARGHRRRPVRHLPDDRKKADATLAAYGSDVIPPFTGVAAYESSPSSRSGCWSSCSRAPAARPRSSSGTTTAATAATNKDDLNLKTIDQLTIGTDNPAFPPWFGGTPHKPVAGQRSEQRPGLRERGRLCGRQTAGLRQGQVMWIHVPFTNSYAPGPKPFDFDINQISFTPARAKVVDFSDSYYDVNQSVVVNKGTPIASVTSVAGLKPYDLGAQLGTTSYGFIKDKIKPTKQPSVFPSNTGAVQALKNKQIDGLVVDLPTAFYVTAVQVPNGKVARPVPGRARRRAFRDGLREGQLAPHLC